MPISNRTQSQGGWTISRKSIFKYTQSVYKLHNWSTSEHVLFHSPRINKNTSERNWLTPPYCNVRLENWSTVIGAPYYLITAIVLIPSKVWVPQQTVGASHPARAQLIQTRTKNINNDGWYIVLLFVPHWEIATNYSTIYFVRMLYC